MEEESLELMNHAFSSLFLKKEKTKCGCYDLFSLSFFLTSKSERLIISGQDMSAGQ